MEVIEKIKIIKLKQDQSKITSKKQLYKDILSSSKKVKDFIKKTKINKSKYYREPRVFEPIEQQIPNRFEPIEPIEPIEQQIPNRFEPIEQQIPNRFEPIEPIKKQSLAKQTKCNKTNYFQYKPKKIEKRTLKNNTASTNKSKKINVSYNPNNILTYFNSNKKQTINIFTKKQIEKFINVLFYYSDNESYKNIHKYIKKLNKYQTLQILYDIKLITKKSTAPLKLLKNILYNYFCCNLIIVN
jgi:hypothetical protein